MTAELRFSANRDDVADPLPVTLRLTWQAEDGEAHEQTITLPPKCGTLTLEVTEGR